MARKPDKRTIGYQGESEEGEIIYEVIFDQVAVRRMAAPHQANYEHSAVDHPETEERSLGQCTCIVPFKRRTMKVGPDTKSGISSKDKSIPVSQ